MYPKSKFFTCQIPYANKYKCRNSKVEKTFSLRVQSWVGGWKIEVTAKGQEREGWKQGRKKRKKEEGKKEGRKAE